MKLETLDTYTILCIVFPTNFFKDIISNVWNSISPIGLNIATSVALVIHYRLLEESDLSLLPTSLSISSSLLLL